MSSLSSYPRTELPRDLTSIARSAYANVPEPLRSKIIGWTARHANAFGATHQHLSFLTPSYVNPEWFGDFFREDNDGRVFPEPGATAGAMPRLPVTLNPAIDRESNPQIQSLPANVLNSFIGVVELATTLSDDTVVWRFIGANYTELVNGITVDSYTCNMPGGAFWGVGPVPTTEANWRRFYAIPAIWNGDGGYVAFRLGDLPSDIQGVFRQSLIGTVAAQPSMVPGYYLEGGGRQLVAPLQISKHEAFFNAAVVHRSVWNL